MHLLGISGGKVVHDVRGCVCVCVCVYRHLKLVSEGRISGLFGSCHCWRAASSIGAAVGSSIVASARIYRGSSSDILAPKVRYSST